MRPGAASATDPGIRKERVKGEHYYDGPLPGKELKIAMYLYYKGVVSFQDVARALAWQRDMRPPIGRFACEWGWLSDADVTAILKATHIVGLFAERAVEMGLLTTSERTLLLMHQRASQKFVGAYFVANKIISSRDLSRYLKEVALHNQSVRNIQNRIEYFASTPQQP